MLRKNLSKIIKRTPSDVKNAIGFFCIASLAIPILLFPLANHASRDAAPDLPIEPCGLEPYILQTDLTLSVSADLSVSEQSDITLLSSACEELLGNESYGIRVAFCALILNRCSDDSFPSSVSAVLKSAGIYPESLKNTVSERTLHAVHAAMRGVDPSMGALYMMNHKDASLEEYRERVTAILPPYAFIH